MVIVLLFLSVVECLVTEPPFVELDRKLHDEMTAPQEVAENTFKMLLKYYIQMYDMYRSFRSGNDSYSGMVSELKRQGGPLLTTAFVDGKTLHYDPVHSELLKQFLNTIDQFWAMIVKKASAVETLLKS
uniref:Uncharacterized protein n=1 Tax=Cuerna arida TaxID=1464854 RepID=A0A1B6G660_9HEMI